MRVAVSAFVAGLVLAALAVVGGVSAITPTANSTSESDKVVTYDSP
jgi:hypothetical protein